MDSSTIVLVISVVLLCLAAYALGRTGGQSGRDRGRHSVRPEMATELPWGRAEDTPPPSSGRKATMNEDLGRSFTHTNPAPVTKPPGARQWIPGRAKLADRTPARLACEREKMYARRGVSKEEAEIYYREIAPECHDER